MYRKGPDKCDSKANNLLIKPISVIIKKKKM